MKTKLIIFAAILMLSGRIAMAQTQEKGKTSFGILGGVNFQTFNGKDGNGDKLENDILIGYHAGINIAIPIVPQFYFQPGVLFSIKGSSNEYGTLTGKFKLSYLELPLNVVYKGLLGNGHIMVGFGPYIGYGIGGTASIEDESTTLESDIVFTDVVEVGDPILVAYVKRFDAGGNIFAGYEMAGGLFFQLNAQLGMLNIMPEDNRIISNNSNIKNTGYGLSLGYRF
jgi:hypothetical protein